MHPPLAPMTSSEFARLANLAGLHIGEDDLIQLDRRQILRPFGPSAYYTSGHLYVLALYFDAIQVVRHPWATRAPERRLEDVKLRGQWLDGLLTASKTGAIDSMAADAAANLLMEIERFLAEIDPFGPLSNIFNIMHPSVFDGLRGDGRLYAELNAAAKALSDLLENATAVSNDDPEEDLRSTAAIDMSATIAHDVNNRVAHERATVESELTADDIADIRDRQPDNEAFTTPSGPTKAVRPARPSEQAEPTEPARIAPATTSVPDHEPTVIPPEPPVRGTDALHEHEGLTGKASKVIELIDTAPAAPRPARLEETPQPTVQIDETDDETDDEHDQPPTAAEGGVAAEAQFDDFDDDEGVAQPTQILPFIEARERAPILSEKKGFERSTAMTERTQNLMERLNQLRSTTGLSMSNQAADQVTSQIEELNRLREQYLQAQNWAALADLYESKINLFEDPAEKQQIRIALATIYEAKLNQPRRAFESYIFAYEIDAPARERALDGVRRTGKSADVHNSYQAWLEDRLTHDINADERRELQGDLALLLHARGDSQRAFLMFAAFLAEDPDRHVTTDSLEQLEELSLSVDGDELEAFYADIVDAGPSPRVMELVALRAGLVELSQNRPIHAIPLFRKVLEVAPTNDVAFVNLSRLYEAEENWSDLASILRKRITHVAADQRPKIEAALERAYEHEMRADIDAISKWQFLLESTPDDEQALNRYVFGLQAHQRHSDAYAFLTRLMPQVTTETQKVAILLHLADIATNFLSEPDEGQHHAEQALEIAGPTVEVLGSFVEVHMARGDYMNAVRAVESLLATGASMSKEDRLEWLHVGVDAAERAHRGEERERFLEEIRQLESTHP